jgi:3-methyladenine DNA glycosylase Tag
MLSSGQSGQSQYTLTCQQQQGRVYWAGRAEHKKRVDDAWGEKKHDYEASWWALAIEGVRAGLVHKVSTL